MAMPSERFRVRVTKDHLVFSAAHFVTIGPICERLHGHNWRVAAEVEGALDENSFVIDFWALRDELQAIVDQLEHRVLLPTRHASIRVNISEREVEATFADRRWVFPREECLLLAIDQTSAERIAAWISDRLLERLATRGCRGIAELRIEVEENFGQWATRVWRAE
jgi:6-pyruvoyltetrahydropterin/6-carboxytetrahydropterin synthase